MELMVAIVLSGILLTMVMSVLRDLTRSPALQPSDGSASWEQIVREDLKQLVPANRSAVPPIQYVPPTDIEPYPVLILQTFSRIGQYPGRGPAQVRYTISSSEGYCQLTRSAQGWHDPHASETVLLRKIHRWSISGDIVTKIASAPSAQKAQSGIVSISVQTENQTQQVDFWVRIDVTTPPPVTEPAP